MGFNLGSTFVTIGAVTKPLDKALAGVKEKLKATAAEKPSLGLGAMLGVGIGVGMKALDMALGVIEGLITAIPKAAMAAENLEHVIHRNKFMFQSMYPFIEKTVESLQKFGYTKSQLGGVSAKLGEMFVGMGMNENATAKLSSEFLKLGVDAAAFHQMDLPDYMETLERGLEGNVKALKRMGIFLMDGQVEMEKMRLASMGMLGSFEEQNKKLAIMSIVYGRLKNFQGEAARQMKMLTGEMKSVDAKARSLVTSFGEVVKPLWVSGIKLFESTLVGLMEIFERNKTTIKEWSDSAKNSIDSIRFYFENVGTYAEKFKLQTKGSFIAIGIAILDWKKTLIESAYAVGKGIDEFFSGFGKGISNISSDLVIFAKWFQDLWTRMFESNEKTTGRVFQAITDGLTDMVTSIITSFTTGKPIEFKFRPSVAPGVVGLPAAPEFKSGAGQAIAGAVGAVLKATPLINMEELKKAAALNEEQLKKIEETLKKQLDAFNKANKLPKEKIPPLQRPQMFPGSATTGGFVGIADFAKRIQEGALGKDAYAMATAVNTKRMAEMMAMWGPRMFDMMAAAGMVGP